MIPQLNSNPDKLYSIVLLFAFLTIVILPTSSAIAENRFALVIGNSDYAEEVFLEQAAKDASDIAATLQQAGFEITQIHNAPQEEMESAFETFRQKLTKGGVGLFYFSGYGVQYQGENYLLPIGSIPMIKTPSHLKYKAVNAGYLLTTMVESGSELNIMILDACRKPLSPVFDDPQISPGLAPMTAPAGTLIAYPASPNMAAFDSNRPAENNSPYIKALKEHIPEENLQLEILFRRVRTTVMKETQEQQAPTYYSGLSLPFCFLGACEGSPYAYNPPPPPPEVFRIHGSTTMGETLVPALMNAYLAELGVSRSDITTEASQTVTIITINTETGEIPKRIEIMATGTSQGFEAFERDNTDVIMSSRSMTANERKFFPILKEYLIALDGVAIIVHPDNPVQELTREQIADIFAGNITDWSEVTGKAGHINIYTPETRSETYEIFKRLVLQDKTLALNAKSVKSNLELVEDVAKDPDAISFVGMAFIEDTKTVNIKECALSYPPTRFSIKTEDYPLSRRLYLYIPETMLFAFVNDFIAFALSDKGQQIVREEGFADFAIELEMPKSTLSHQRLFVAPMTTQDQEILREYVEMITNGVTRLSATFRFRFGSSMLDDRAVQDLERLVDYLANNVTGGQRVILLGFADIVGNNLANIKLSRGRALQIASQLKKHDLKLDAKGYGENMPVACNDSRTGYEKNRRVEVWIMPQDIWAK